MDSEAIRDELALPSRATPLDPKSFIRNTAPSNNGNGSPTENTNSNTNSTGNDNGVRNTNGR